MDQADDQDDRPESQLVRAQDVDASQRPLVPPTPGRTLLPGPIASAVSFATRSTSFALRVGTLIGGYGIGAAKVTTLSSLELGRGILEGILSRAGKDVMARSRTEMARTDSETILERSLENLHQTMSQIVFWTTTGFHITGTTVSAVSQISQLFLGVLDQFFGSTDSSRAIASIITLIRREFQNPATGVQGERVGVVDLLLGLCGLAYLQNWCRKAIQEEAYRTGQEEVIWDVVVLNDGERVDVDQPARPKTSDGVVSDGSDPPGLLEALEQHGARRDSGDEDDSPELQLKRQILSALPREAKVSISTSTTTTKMITVDIKGTTEVPLPSLPGLDLVDAGNAHDLARKHGRSDEPSSNYRVVYKVSRNKVRSTADESENEEEILPRIEHLDEDGAEVPAGLEIQDLDQPPPVPPKVARPTIASAAKGRSVSNEIPDRHVRPRSDSSGGSTGGSPRDKNYAMRPDPIGSEHTANQKRTRKPLDELRGSTKAPSMSPQASSKRQELIPPKPSEKKGSFKSALKKGSVPGFGNLLSRDSSSDQVPTTNSVKPKSNLRPPWGSHKLGQGSTSSNPTSIPRIQKHGPVPDRHEALIPLREAPRAPQRGTMNHFSSRDLGDLGVGDPDLYRSPSRSSYVPLQESRRRSSVVSLTDTFSIHSYESRPSSPTSHRKSGHDWYGALRGNPKTKSQNPSLYTPSIYTLRTRGSQTSLAVSSFHPQSAYSNSEAVNTLRQTGTVEGMFPDAHILRNITRYSRYASAAYGSNFLKLMGIAKDLPAFNVKDETHHDVRYFAHHTELPSESILLSSFVDPQGGSDSTGSTDTGIPLVHTVALDEESKAVVLSCRGTLGFEDVLADMMCEYDDLVWRGRTYQVHKGIHASARRLLYGGDGRVLYTLKEALEEFPDYGLVLCGHSLGGAVTALLGAMLAEPAVSGPAFVTSAAHHQRQLPDRYSQETSDHLCLPSGRPIHVYAYGPPATMSPSLQKATRGLITSVVNGNDLVPYLSLGVLHDFQAVALAFKTDNNEAKAEVRRRIWEGLQSGLADKWYNNAPKHTNQEDDQWAYAALKTLRASMMSSKLYPPGEVFAIESTPVLRKDAFMRAGTEQFGRPATRLVLKYIRDVEARFREVRFGASMLMDHSPGKYEDALRRLMMGVVDA
ncbi:hypothetical protein F4780DRAFT_395206 [Xylariomycetidae sp. FL0641]|nr:hypothetical protein F4780DRAFT_395206 [Xylariomycetidae sp. FL0641]